MHIIWTKLNLSVVTFLWTILQGWKSLYCFFLKNGNEECQTYAWSSIVLSLGSFQRCPSAHGSDLSFISIALLHLESEGKWNISKMKLNPTSASPRQWWWWWWKQRIAWPIRSSGEVLHCPSILGLYKEKGHLHGGPHLWSSVTKWPV